MVLKIPKGKKKKKRICKSYWGEKILLGDLSMSRRYDGGGGESCVASGAPWGGQMATATISQPKTADPLLQYPYSPLPPRLHPSRNDPAPTSQ